MYVNRSWGWSSDDCRREASWCHKPTPPPLNTLYPSPNKSPPYVNTNDNPPLLIGPCNAAIGIAKITVGTVEQRSCRCDYYCRRHRAIERYIRTSIAPRSSVADRFRNSWSTRDKVHCWKSFAVNAMLGQVLSPLQHLTSGPNVFRVVQSTAAASNKKCLSIVPFLWGSQMIRQPNTVKTGCLLIKLSLNTSL